MLSDLPNQLLDYILDMAIDSFALSDATEMNLTLVCHEWKDYVTSHFFSRMSKSLHTLADASPSEHTTRALNLVDILLAYFADDSSKMHAIPFPPITRDGGGDFNVIIVLPTFFGAIFFNDDLHDDMDIVWLYVKNTRLAEKARACYGSRQHIALGRNRDTVHPDQYIHNVNELLDFRTRCHAALSV